MVNAERLRLDEADTGGVCWRRWGPYLSERQWGTVREDYGSGDGTWSYFSHDQARSRAYRWGEDGLAGISDDGQRLCLALSLWNGRDPILKERLFGLTNAEGNHGEDVKECYFYLDATPTSSYLKMLYKHPQAEFPYADLIAVNAARGKSDPEYELLDTGIFNGNRYFDVVVEYAKATPEDLLMQVTVHNRGPDDARLHVLPTLWFRHTWSWAGGGERPSLRTVTSLRGVSAVRAEHSELGSRWLYADQQVPVLVTGNETNNERAFGSANETPYVKDGIDSAVVHGDAAAVDPGGAGTKAALHYSLVVPGGGSAALRLRLTDTERVKPGRTTAASPFADFDELMHTRRGEADEFWAGLLAGDLTADERLVVRQALAGILWSKQYYALDVERWLAEHGADPLDADTWLRNHDWRHLVAEDIISMPDTWEYPWFAAWDLAFHAVALAVVDVAFAKQQHSLLLDRRYLHPNGQLPAYEWNFSDVNPPVHAWATLFVYQIEDATAGKGDRAFLEDSFQKLMKNFGWWLNRKDADNRNDSHRPGGAHRVPQLVQGVAGFLARHPLVTAALPGRGVQVSGTGPVLLALFDEARLRRILARMLDEEEFLGPHGIRSVSRWHAEHPYVIKVGGQEYGVGYRPAESDTGMFGGNSNWRGPVWFPINVMLIRALLNLHVFFGDTFTVECPTGSGRLLNLFQVAREISDRLTATFLADADGRRPVHGGQPILQADPHWRDLLLFYEYFHGDNGAGIGASHQTGWTGTAGLLPLLFRGITAEGLRTRCRGAFKSAAAGRRTAAER